MTSTSGTSATSVATSSTARATLSVRRRRALIGGRAVQGVGAHATSRVFGPARARRDDGAGDDVDDQRQHEQHEAGGDQRRAVQLVVGRLAELVGDHRGERVALGEDRVADLRRVADHERDRDRLADRAAEPEHRAAGDAGARVREHRDADHLPARRAERERRLLVVGRHRRDHLARDRRDDRQDHDREDQPGDEVVRARRRRPPTNGRKSNVRPNHCSAGLSFGIRTKTPQRP